MGIIEKLLLVSVGLFVALCLVVWFFQNAMLYHPQHNASAEAWLKEQAPAFEKLVVNGTFGERYEGWMRRSKVQPAKTILCFGGNTMSAANTLAGMKLWDSNNNLAAYNFIMVDYPGYGLSSGMPGDNAIYAMALSVFDEVRRLFPASLPYILGYSLGSGPAIYTASQKDCAGLIVIAPYDNGLHLFNQYVSIFHGPLAGIIKNRFPSDSFAPLVTEKTLAVISADDKVIANSLSYRLLEFFPKKPELLVLKGVSHNHLFFSEPRVMKRVAAFIQ